MISFEFQIDVLFRCRFDSFSAKMFLLDSLPFVLVLNLKLVITFHSYWRTLDLHKLVQFSGNHQA